LIYLNIELTLFNKTDLLSEEEVENTNVSLNLVKLFQITEELQNDINTSSVDDKLGADYSISRDGSFLIAEERLNISDAGLANIPTNDLLEFVNL